ADLGQRAIILGRPGQEILERTNVRIDDDGFEARLLVNLPAKGRRILGRQAADILTRNVPELARTMFLHSGLDAEALRQHVQLDLRSRLGDEGLVAFVGNDAILPRRSGDSDLPMDTAAVPFRSPDSLETTFVLASGRSVTGMAIPHGVTVIVGGGYHGKSTIL